MKRCLLLLSMIVVIGAAASANTYAQGGKARPALPANLKSYVGKYPDDFVKITAVKSRLKTLLGTRYSAFIASLATQMPFTREGNFIFASGCLAHSCGESESAIAIDTVNKRIHVGIFRSPNKVSYFNEDNAATPASVRSWADALRSH